MMKNSLARLVLGCICALSVVLASACEDDLTCGPGTVEVDGQCVLESAVTDGAVPEGGWPEGGGAAGTGAMGGTGAVGGTGGSGGTGPGGDAAVPPTGTGLTCGEGTQESNGECVPVEADPTDKPIGSPCASSDECESGFCMPDADNLPGGYCTVVNCGDETPCPPGSTCYAVTVDLNMCMAFCDSDEVHCRPDEDYICQPLYGSDLNICAPYCQLTDSCPAGTKCDPEVGACILPECDPDADDPCDAANTDEICYPETEGLTELGGLCMVLCDPAYPEADCKVNKGDVCQPLVEDPANTGFCAPPVCNDTEQCPAGAFCQDHVCQPPPLCGQDGACSDETTSCLTSVGKCMTKCPTDDTTCADIHSGLTCAEINDPALCLPTGSFPSSPCRDTVGDECDSVTVEGESADMVCIDDMCLVDCEDGGDTLCEDLDATLACAEGIFDVDVCLPKGAYPGGPCASGDTCDDLDMGDGESADMVCEDDMCLVECGTSGDVLCEAVESSLVCATGIFDNDVCLPKGSFPGGPCKTDGTCDDVAAGTDTAGMVCEEDMCLVDCSDTDPCADVSATLTCSTGVFDTDVCLPIGSFPGGPCRETEGDECDDNVSGIDDADMVCTGSMCLVGCTPGPEGDELCAQVDASLTCSTGIFDEDVCLPKGSFPGGPCKSDNTCDDVAAGEGTASMVCEDDMCLVDCSSTDPCADVDDTLVCAPGIFDTDVCLPAGSFPGGPCGDGGLCAQDVGGLVEADMICNAGTCVVDCSEDGQWEGYGDTLCSIVSDAMTCSESAGNICVAACFEGACAEGYSCLDPGTVPAQENACLPNGSFVGSQCAEGALCSDIDLTGVGGPFFDVICSPTDVCVVNCDDEGSPGDPDETICATFDSVFGTDLTCSPSAGNTCVTACQAGECPEGYSCLDPGGEDACLPNGSFVGSQCAEGGLCSDLDLTGVGGPYFHVVCSATDVCVVNCDDEGSPGTPDETVCTAFDAVFFTDLTCSLSAGNTCVTACQAGECPEGFSCLDPGGENACLPNGSFVGSQCAEGAVCDDLDLTGVGGPYFDVVCSATDVCVVNCDDEGSPGTPDETVCAAFDAVFFTDLTCSLSAGNTCVAACDGGACDEGFSCLDPGGENACLPDGTFPGSACRDDPTDECDQDLGGNELVDMICVTATTTCGVACPSQDVAGDAFCVAVGMGFTNCINAGGAELVCM